MSKYYDIVVDSVGGHPEAVCKFCGGHNPVWSAENGLFNEVNGSPDGIICPICFDTKAKQKGIDVYFRATRFSDRQNVEGLKKLLRLTNCPEILIENPSLLEGVSPTEKDFQWANRAIKIFEDAKAK